MSFEKAEDVLAVCHWMPGLGSNATAMELWHVSDRVAWHPAAWRDLRIPARRHAPVVKKMSTKPSQTRTQNQNMHGVKDCNVSLRGHCQTEKKTDFHICLWSPLAGISSRGLSGKNVRCFLVGSELPYLSGCNGITC
eukprot:3007411-Amphidinium_carterae.1